MASICLAAVSVKTGGAIRGEGSKWRVRASCRVAVVTNPVFRCKVFRRFVIGARVSLAPVWQFGFSGGRRKGWLSRGTIVAWPAPVG